MNVNDYNSISSIIDKLTSKEFYEFARNRISRSPERMTEIMRFSCAEARWAFDLLSTYNLKEKHILEIGSGSGVLSAILKYCGYDVTCIEPATDEFSFYHEFSKAVFEFLKLDKSKILPVPVCNLQPDIHGKFDFIFSINVLEHTNDTHHFLTGLNSLLEEHGTMVHVCPNYTVPYEPHFGIFLFPLFPSLTGIVLNKKIKDNPLWSNLNFVTSREVVLSAKKNNCKISFKKHMIFETLKRFETDEEFTKRQSGFPLMLFNILKKLHMLELTKMLPHQIQTPLVFEWRK